MALTWREASSIIITARSSIQELLIKGKDLSSVLGGMSKKEYQRQPVGSCDYRILMVKRSSLSSFMANAYVFPGGLVEIADFSSNWWSVFEKVGISKKDITEFCNNVVGPRPSMVKNPVTLSNASYSVGQNHIPADIAFRIAAIRETFEETGILLLTNPSRENTQESLQFILKEKNVDVNKWRDEVHKNPYRLIDMCVELDLCPDVWSLYEWSDWLTPTSVGHRRYDTMFYFCCLPKQPEVSVDNAELTTLKWTAPDAMLEDNFHSEIFLAPPQVYELSRLTHFNSYHRLHSFVKQRATKGCEQWMPVLASAQDGALSLLPGDELYPENPDFLGILKNLEYPYHLEELRGKCHELNRIEIRGPLSTIHCNITCPCGHLQPLQYRSPQPPLQSYL